MTSDGQLLALAGMEEPVEREGSVMPGIWLAVETGRALGLGAGTPVMKPRLWLEGLVAFVIVVDDVASVRPVGARVELQEEEEAVVVSVTVLVMP